MKKDLIKYEKEYGDIPEDNRERLNYILNILKITDKHWKDILKCIPKLRKPKFHAMNFIIYVIPKATPRARLGKYNRFYVSDAKFNNDLFGKFINDVGLEKGVITTPCRFITDIYLPIPSAFNKIEKVLAELKLLPAIVKPDWDNAGKTYSDMIQKHLLLDDSLIFDGRVRKYYSFKPRVEMTIEFMDKYDCKSNKKKIEGWKTYKEIENNIIEKDSMV